MKHLYFMKIVPYTLLLESEKDLGKVPPLPAITASTSTASSALSLWAPDILLSKITLAINLPFCLSDKGKEHILAEVFNSQE
jgi:hypothetical protein